MIKEAVLKFIKKHKRPIIVILCIVLAGILLWNAAVAAHLVFPGVDLFVKPESGPFALVTRGYMRLRTETSKCDADEPVTVTINTAFFETEKYAKTAQSISFIIVCSQYLELKPSSFSAEKCPVDWDTDGVYGPVFPEDELFLYKTTDFQYADLLYTGFKGFFATRYALPYCETFTLRVKEDAPQEFDGVIRFYAGADHPGDGGLSDDNEAWLYYYFDGDYIYFSGESQSHAKALES